MPGHWEGDLIAGSANTHIATLVERQTRYLLLVKVAGKDTAAVVDAITARVQTPVQLRAGLTWDRGMELAEHRRFSVADRCRGPLLRPAQPQATRPQREHERAAAPVLPEADRPLGVQSGRPRRRRHPAQRPTPQDPRLEIPGLRPSVHYLDADRPPSRTVYSRLRADAGLGS